MTAGRTGKPSRIVFCSCAYYDIIPRETRERVFSSLHEAGVSMDAVADLCGLAAAGDARLKEWAQADSLSIVACYPRAVRWLFEAGDASLRQEQTRLFNMRTQSPEAIVGEILAGRMPAGPTAGTLPEREEGWVPWFPVIDYDRCKNCKQCMNFCLFGVYGLSPQGRVEVQNPAGCKTNCPACARMCPAGAIIFPKYGESPINGDEVQASPEAKAEAPRDLRSLLQGDMYDKIRRRTAGRKRFSTDREETPAGPPCPTIEALRRDLGIPDDVLTSLSPAELQRIRAQARPAGDADTRGESRDG